MSSAKTLLQQFRIQAEDVLRFDPTVRDMMASAILARTSNRPAATTAEAVLIVSRLSQAARLASTDTLMLRVEKRIDQQLPSIRPAEIPWEQFLPDFGTTQIHKAIILKPYISEREKGVVFISFDNQMVRLAKSTDLAAFARRYTLVLSPQWCPPHSVAAYLFPLLYPDPILSLISNTRDLTYLPRISRSYQVVPLYASSWVDPRKYTPVPRSEKNIDIFMLANFAKYKRHHALFAALRDMPRGLRVVLNGQREKGRTRDTILHEAGLFGVRDRIEVRENVTDVELHDNFVRARISLILSRREGSCVAVIESMFADTPVGLYADAEVGTRAFINPLTGRLLQHANLGAQLVDFLRTADRYQPRQWVMDNGIDCIASTAVLNNALKQQAAATGQDWTQDIATLRWRPDPQYYNPADADHFSTSYQDIQQRCGITIGRFETLLQNVS